MPGWFELSASNGTHYRFDLKAGNGETILSSGAYESISAARSAIGFVQTACQSDACYEKRIAHSAQAYFVLKDSSNNIIGMSKLYPSVEARDAAIDSMKVNGKTGITINRI